MFFFPFIFSLGIASQAKPGQLVQQAVIGSFVWVFIGFTQWYAQYYNNITVQPIEGLVLGSLLTIAEVGLACLIVHLRRVHLRRSRKKP